MSLLDWAKLVLDVGTLAIKAIRTGNRDATVWDILPDELKDSIRLMEIETQARADYPTEQVPE